MLKFFNFLVLAAICATNCLSSQTQDSILLGPGYTNTVYYSFSGEKSSSPAAAWDIAFEIPGFSSSILINGGKGVQLWNVTGSDGESFDKTIDTTQLFKQATLNNSATSWSSGAFNMGIDYNTGDFGWGEYNMVTHQVTGKTVYVVKLAGKFVKKIIIDALSGGVYSFRYSNIDGSDLQTKTIAKKDFPNKNFMYFSLENGIAIDREPAQWDLSFGKYVAFVPTPYIVTGALTNRGIKTAVYYGSSPKTASLSGLPLEENISAIGYNWKTYTGSSYAMSDSLAYFIQTSDSSIKRLIFTGFGGPQTGSISFEFTPVATSSVVENGNAHSILALYPNPAHGTATVLYSTQKVGSEITLAVWDVLGNKLQTTTQIATDNLMQYPVTGLPSGTYIVTMTIAGQTVSQKLIVE